MASADQPAGAATLRPGCNFRERHYGGGRWCSDLARSSLSSLVTELQEEQLAIHQQATAAAAANKQVTIESLIAEAEAARAKAMSEKGGAAAAVSALTAKAKLAGMWREKVDQHNTGNPVYERIERVIVERPPQSAPGNIPNESIYDEPSTEVVREMPGRHWSAD